MNAVPDVTTPSLPRQDTGAGGGSDPDPLTHPDPFTAADAAAVENLLRCWLRETGGPGHPVGELVLPLPASGTALRAPVRHWSPVGHHRFGRVLLDGGLPADAVTLAALLAREAAARDSAPRESAPRGTAPAGDAAGHTPLGRDGVDLVARVADSVRRTAGFLAVRRAEPSPEPGTPPFLDAEQALVLGHPLHPTPKSREGLDGDEAAACSPELRGRFPLHWFAVDRSALAADSAWTRGGRTVPAERLTAELAGLTPPPGAALVPAHPWQAAHLRGQSRVRELIERGLVRDLGPAGDPWYPTSSVRTVCRPGTDRMLKLSLALRITNSRRENLPKELRRGVEVHRLLRTGLGARWRAAHPGFDIVRDPAWLAVTAPGGEPVPGFDLVIRHNPFGPGDDAACVAGLTAPRPWPGGPRDALRSRLADVVTRLAAATGRPRGAVATEWFLRYLDCVVRPVLWLDGEAGIALEAHQQNTLVLLDRDGWPAGGRYRDNQGYYYRASRRAELDAALPGIGADTDTFVADEVADERFAYYLGINNVLGLIGAFGSQGLADERVLLAAFRRFLAELAPGRSALPALLLERPTLRCKANLLTRLHGMDELVGPVDTQSVYVTVPNPLAGRPA
ncbi:IucA/IucC family protein [Streptomyces capparidis]